MNYKINTDLNHLLKILAGDIDEKRVEELLEYCSGEWSVLGELFDLYFSVLTENLQTIVEAEKNSDNESLRTSAHKLKSSSKNVGFQKIGLICEWLENLGKNQQIQNLEDEIKMLEDSCKNIKSISQDFLTQKKAA